ncbi:ABC transporter substrate-binding protein [Lapidilactobacillus luobeiensis]|uniref:ABC transporter substrate-binding protein n=1 Tax=Lapidilactobacillus luobeiensis TaxID=2950371 RepID=UPI0021C37E43|nr:extracellular solute-binding protein [Lapidilactobacillus luobeiensis]
MKVWQKVLATAAVAGVALSLGACGNGSDKDSSADKSGSKKTVLKVTTWNYATTPEFAALFKAFEKEHPNVDVQQVDVPADDYDTKVTTMMSSGDTTDILTMKNLLSYSNYALRDQLVDLSSHVKDIDQGPAADTYKMYKVKGKTYAQPYRTDFWVLYYNKKLFDAAGIDYPDNWTWDDYVTNAKKLTDASKGQYGTYQHIWRSTIQAIAAAQNDKNLMDPSSYEFMKPYYERALDLQKSKAQMTYGTAKSTKVTYNSQFEESKAAMLYMGTWFMGGLVNDTNSGQTNVEWSIAPMPQKSSNGKTTTFGSPTGFAINKNSKNKKIAQEFLDFCSGEKGAKVMAKIGITPSYRNDAVNKIYFATKGMPTDDVAKKAFNPDKIAVEFPVAKDGPAVDKILQEEHDLIMVGDETPSKAISNMQSRVKEELK